MIRNSLLKKENVLQQLNWDGGAKLCWFQLAGRKKITCHLKICSATERITHESLWPLERDLCTSIFEEGCFLTCTSFSESFHYRGREAVQSFPAQPCCGAPSGAGPPAVPGRRLDPVSGSGSGGAAKTQRSLQQEIVLGTLKQEVKLTPTNRGA